MRFQIKKRILKAWKDRSQGSGSLARSISLGMFIGFSPTVGAQVIISIIVCAIINRVVSIKFNTLVVVIGTLVVNPITMAPTYFLYYKIGCLVVSCDLPPSAGMFSSLSAVSSLSVDIAQSVVVGSIPFMIFGTIFGYGLGEAAERLLSKRHDLRRKKRMAMRSPSSTQQA